MSSQALLTLLAVVAVVHRILFSAAEVAYARMPRRRAKALYEQRGRGAARLLFALLQDPEGAFAAARTGAMVSLALAASLGGGALLLSWPDTWPIPSGAGLALPFVLGGGAAGLLSLLLELVPRALATAKPERWALALSPLLGLAFLCSAGPASLLRRLLDRLLAPLGARTTFRVPDPALEEIERILVEASAKEVGLPSPELLESVFELPALSVRDAMIPRTEVVALKLHAENEELLRRVIEEGHTCYPVYDDRIDRVVGLLHTKDLVPFLQQPEALRIVALLRPATFVPWTTRLGGLLLRMQRESLSLAVVTDEHGGFLGIVTVGDILRELMGGFALSEPAEAIVAEADGSHLVDASLPIDAFNQHFAAALPEDNGFGTLAGFLNHLAGAIPEEGQRLEAQGLCFQVMERSPQRVLQVRVEKRNEAADVA